MKFWTVVSLPKLKCKIPNCSSKLRGKLIVFPSTGCSKKLLTEEKNPNQSECWGAKFSHENDLILLSLSKKRPKNIFPDIEGAAYGWFKQHSISQLFWDTLYVNIKTSFENFPTFSTKKFNTTGAQCRILNCTGKLRRKLISNLVMSWSQRAEKTSHLGTSLKSHKKRIESKQIQCF